MLGEQHRDRDLGGERGLGMKARDEARLKSCNIKILKENQESGGE